tara:strand:+ start:2921 stop:4645 length:1725 start_codon:yes stop_codon:yes gene_type:complete
MSWNTILKKRKLHSIYFQEFKNALLDVVKELPEGTKFYVTDMDIKNKFVENLKQTDIRPQDISSWVNVRLETWLVSIGNRIVSNSDLAGKVISGKVTSHIRKAPINNVRMKMDIPANMRTIATPYKGVFQKDSWRTRNPLASIEANQRRPFGGTGSKPFGLWYGLGTQWIDWVCENMGCDGYKYFYEVKIVGNVLKLDTKQDHIDFWEKYKQDTFKQKDSNYWQRDKEGLSHSWKFYNYLPYINWAKVQEDYDGIEVMGGKYHNAALYDSVDSERQRDKDFPKGSIKWAYSWDVDSGCIWNTDAIEIGQLLFSEDDPEWNFNKAETVTQARTKLLTDTEQLPDEEEDEEDEPVPEEEPSDDCLEYYRRITDVIEDFVNQYKTFGFYPYEEGKYDFSTADFSYNFSGKKVGNKFKGSHMSKLVDSNMTFVPNDRTNYNTMHVLLVDFIYTKSENISRKDACRLLWLIHSGGWTSYYETTEFWTSSESRRLNTYESNALKNSRDGERVPNYGLQLLVAFKKPNIVRYSNYPRNWKERIISDINHFDIQAEYMMEKIVDIADEWVTNNFDDALKYRP